MKGTPTLPDTKPSALDHIKQSALEYIINYLFDGLEACERNPLPMILSWDRNKRSTTRWLIFCAAICLQISLLAHMRTKWPLRIPRRAVG
jgi:hypothetical protein